MRFTYVGPNPESGIDHVGTYQRSLPVSLERMYENALDWEHLPHLHASSFSAIECLDSGSWGWRAEVVSAAGETSLLELRLDRSCRRWITRNLAGRNKGAEIWTHVFVTEPHAMDLVIDFFVPGVPVEAREKVGMAYARAYEQLYDEDVWMMTERQRQLDRRVSGKNADETLSFAVPQHDAAATAVEFAGRKLFVTRYSGEWLAYPAACPHQLGPLTDSVSATGEVECPWHAYRFDVRTGQCTTGAACAFGPMPSVRERDGQLILSWA